MTATTGSGFVWPGSAAETALRVLRWAAAPQQVPPFGRLHDVAHLHANGAVAAALADLTWTTAARLAAGIPPLGDASSAGLGGAFLAASVGGRDNPHVARRLAAVLAPPSLHSQARGWVDALARHAVLGPAVTALTRTSADPSLMDDWLAASPLTGVLVQPPSGQWQQALDTVAALLDRPRGTEVLANVLSRFEPAESILTWRGRLLSWLAPRHPAAVVAVYAAARSRYAAEWDRPVAEAVGRLSTGGRRSSITDSDVAIVGFWGALAVRQVADLVSGLPWEKEVGTATNVATALLSASAEAAS